MSEMRRVHAIALRYSLAILMALWSPVWCCCFAVAGETEAGQAGECHTQRTSCHGRSHPKSNPPAEPGPSDSDPCACPDIAISNDWSQAKPVDPLTTPAPFSLAGQITYGDWTTESDFCVGIQRAEPPPDAGRGTLFALHCLLIV